jgi:hypothetical protein
MLSLYPRYSLVRNIGLDGSGTHGGTLDIGNENLADTPVSVEQIPLIHSDQVFREFARFNRRLMGGNFGGRLIRRLRKLAIALAG